MSEYRETAEKFLRENGIRFSARFIDYGPHFDDEKDSRDRFRCTLSRARERIVILFGQSLNGSDGGGGHPPDAYDLLSVITKDDPGTFGDFCGDFGYDTDSRRAHRIWEAVVKEWQKVNRFFTAGELEVLRGIQ